MRSMTGFRADSPEYYGFGVGIMKSIKVCVHCGASEPSDRYVCGRCGARLPDQTLFQKYQQMHRRCPVCDTVLTESMKFCPHCGMKQTEKKIQEET